MTQLLNLISGIGCLLSSCFVLYILHIDYAKKTHYLRMFQLAFFTGLFVIGVLQIVSHISFTIIGYAMKSYNDYFSVIFILACLSVIPYFRHYKRKQKIHSL